MLGSSAPWLAKLIPISNNEKINLRATEPVILAHPLKCWPVGEDEQIPIGIGASRPVRTGAHEPDLADGFVRSRDSGNKIFDLRHTFLETANAKLTGALFLRVQVERIVGHHKIKKLI